MPRSLFFVLAIFFSGILAAQTPVPSAGKIVHIDSFHSRFVSPRNIDIWLPPDYSKKKKYAVLYMHDGQMLFDSTHTWNKEEWGVDEAMLMLLKNNQIRETIVVGIYNTNDRWLEYFPAKPFNKLPVAWQDSMIAGMQLRKAKAMSDDYLKFMVKELKPYIDSAFSTLKDMSNTFTAGSSMGGLISMYAVCEYPDVFGGAACLSTHWPGGYEPDEMIATKVFNEYMRQKLPPAFNHRFYFDHGTETLDKHYEPHQKMIDSTVRSKGYNKDSWLSLQYYGADHSEKSWSKRLAAPLFFLLRKPVEIK